MPDKLWNISVEGFEKDSPNSPGELRPELVATMIPAGKNYPTAGFLSFYDDMPKSSWPVFVKACWEGEFKRLVKLGLTQAGPLKLVGSNIPDGITRKIHRVLLKGFGNAIDFGDSLAKQRGCSHSDDFDDDGKKKHGK